MLNHNIPQQRLKSAVGWTDAATLATFMMRHHKGALGAAVAGARYHDTATPAHATI